MQEEAATKEYVPAPQSSHANDSKAVLALTSFFPGSHAVQEPDDSPEYLPVSHELQEVDDCREYFPASQAVQLEDAAEELKEPASQAKQVSDDVAPVAELYRPATQSLQVSEDAAAEVEENFPASQGMQLLDPEPLYFPASQSTQAELESPRLGL